MIFDWGGTLTPWHDLELADMWRAICSAHLPPDARITALDEPLPHVERWHSA